MNASPPSAPRFRDLLGFQFGHRPSIERLAASRWTIPIGLILVASAALALRRVPRRRRKR